MEVNIDKLKNHIGDEKFSDFILECVKRLAASEGNDFIMATLKSCGVVEGEVLILKKGEEHIEAGFIDSGYIKDPNMPLPKVDGYMAVWQFSDIKDEKMRKVSFWQIVEDAVKEIAGSSAHAKSSLRGGVGIYVSPYFEKIIRGGVTFVESKDVRGTEIGKSEDKFYTFHRMDNIEKESFNVSFGGKQILIELQNG